MKRPRLMVARLMARRTELENRKRRRTGAPPLAAPGISRMYADRRAAAPDVLGSLGGLGGLVRALSGR